MPSRMAWSSALRLPGLEMVSRRRPSSGSSTRGPPAMARRTLASGAGGARATARLLEDDERVALVHRLTLLAQDLRDGAGVLGLDGHLHLHRLQDDDGVALLDRVADLAFDLPDGAGD